MHESWKIHLNLWYILWKDIAVHEGNIFKGSSEEYNHMHVPPSLLMIYEDASAPNLSI